MKYNRKEFLKIVGKFVLIGGFTKILKANKLFAAAAEKPVNKEYDIKSNLWGYGIDISKCIGCGRCVDACKKENNVPKEPFFFRTWVERYGILENGEVKVDSPNGGLNGFTDTYKDEKLVKKYFVPKICNHCEQPPCVQVCPVGATYTTPDGVTLVDRKYCIGCRYCIQACPYGARYLHPKLHVADKCSLCYHRITKGLLPACVEVCPVKARIVGNLKDPDSEIKKFLNANDIQVLKPHLGTKPKIYYRGMDKEIF